MGWHALAGLARTVFMEARNSYGCSIDLPSDGGLPSSESLMAIVASSGEYAVAWRHSRMLALRLVPGGLPTPRQAGLKPHLTTIVSGGTKVSHHTNFASHLLFQNPDLPSRITDIDRHTVSARVPIHKCSDLIGLKCNCSSYRHLT